MMYWITRLNGICITLGVLSALLIIMSLIIIGATLDQDSRKYSNKMLIAPIIGVLLIIVNVFIPSTKQMCAILIIPKIVNNERIQGNANKLFQLCEAWLDENLKSKKDNNDD